MCLYTYIHTYICTFICVHIYVINTYGYASDIISMYMYMYIYWVHAAGVTGWRRLIGSPKLQIIFHKRATKYTSLLRKMTCKDKGSYESSPPCTHDIPQVSMVKQGFVTFSLSPSNSMCVCMCACACVCVYVYIHVHTYISHIYICVCVHVMCICIHIIYRKYPW